MPTINNATVAAGTGLSTAGNGGRKLVRLSNGWLVAGMASGAAANTVLLRYSTNEGTTWNNLAYTSRGTTALGNFALASLGTRVFVLWNTSDTTSVYAPSFDAVSVSKPYDFNFNNPIDTNQTTFGNVSLAINDAGTELHAAWSSKNSTYSFSFNIRYAKGTINGDGSVTWGAVEQVTALGSTTYSLISPSITLNGAGKVNISSVLSSSGSNQQGVFSFTNADTNKVTDPINGINFNVKSDWGSRIIFNPGVNAYTQSNPVFLFVPQAINGLANGRLWVAWHGKDATDSAKFNIRTSYSDDGGVTWATPTKQTTGNTYDQMNASLTADSQGKVLLTWDAQNATTTQTALKVFNSTWGATTTLTGDGYTSASMLFDNTFKLSMTTPPLIRQSSSGVYFSGNYFTGASVAPASSALGDKTASSVLSYTVTPESGSTVTSIVEKVNGTTVNTYSNPASLSRTFTIPLANWDALKYYNTHTISVTVTDSNGMANTQTYTLNKALANDASLLEGTKAAKDGKDRISTKREIIAGQVGLAAGSTFDAISAQLASGNAFKKFATGTMTVGADGKLVASGLTFKASLVVWYSGNTSVGVWSSYNTSQTNYLGRGALTANNSSTFITGDGAIVTSDGFSIATGLSNVTFNWYAFS